MKTLKGFGFFYFCQINKTLSQMTNQRFTEIVRCEIIQMHHI